MSSESSLPQSKLQLKKFCLVHTEKKIIKCLFLALKLAYDVSIVPFRET